jgi:hypothetical protein
MCYIHIEQQIYGLQCSLQEEESVLGFVESPET